MWDVNATIKNLEFLKNEYTSTTSVRCLEACPYIVEVGAYTVWVGDDNIIGLAVKHSPMQFSPKGVKDILEVKFTNKNGQKVEPKVYGAYEWYKKELVNINDMLEDLYRFREMEQNSNNKQTV